MKLTTDLRLRLRQGQNQKLTAKAKLWAVLVPAMVLPWVVGLTNAVPQAQANGIKINLASGFRPDPQKLESTTSGDYSLSNLSRGRNCRGFANKQPTYTLELEDDFQRLTFLVEGKGINDDATLLIKGPGSFALCGDDDWGLNPYVVGKFPKGTYSVWVGSKKAQTSFGYTLSISEGAQR